MSRNAFLRPNLVGFLKTSIITCLLVVSLAGISPHRPAGRLSKAVSGFPESVQGASVGHFALNSASGNDLATAMVDDGSGHVYVTGSSFSPESGADYLTVKYDASGAIIWTARYNGEGNGGDVANAIYVDTSGSVYVTGASGGAGTGPDYATVKYTAEGVQQWVARYNGPGNDLDEARALAVDASGNVYVTGFSIGIGISKDYATIKYTADGVQQWVARYNGPGNHLDKAAALAVDADGGVYVTGFSIGDGTSRDYATIKYTADGVQQWVARYNGPGNSDDGATALALDGSGNVYVTGYSVGSDTSSDYATIKYTADGVQQWVTRYNGPGNWADGATALAVDAAGNVYVTGLSMGAGSYYDYATVKYTAEGVQQWVARYDGPGNDWDQATALAVDAAGNVYVTGLSMGADSYYDYATVKYTAEGVQQWVARYDGPGNDLDEAAALAVDADGNVYVTGHSVGSDRSEDYATIKYNTNGVKEWVARYDGIGQ